MPAEYIEIHPKNPQENKLSKIVAALKDGAVIIYPTDTVYGIGCDIYNTKAVQRICHIKGVKLEKSNLSFICYDLSDISTYARNISNPVFKVMKKALPGAFTFILDASTEVPKILHFKKKQVGIRIPDHNIARELVRMLGNPIITTSLREDDKIAPYPTDPQEIFEKYKHLVDIVIDGGAGGNIASTIVDTTDDEFNIVRQGAGILDNYL
jgi:tRNA threonylcarbamoyl adenosine modification protein (Sua5/YciO/YrdC/YwlC family)